MTELERIFAFMRTVDERCAERLEPTPYGPVLVTERLGRVHDLNYLRADAAGGASAAELAGEAERILGALRMRHRRVTVSHVHAGRLEPGFRELGWERTSFLVMARVREPDRAADLSVACEVTLDDLRPVWREGLETEPKFADDPEVVEQLVAVKDVVAAAVPTRYYGAEADGRLVAYCELYSADGVGQVEAVRTLDAYQGRGFGSALVLAAVAQSQADGNDVTFLTALENDWPKHLYERLGFEAVASYDSFVKAPA